MDRASETMNRNKPSLLFVGVRCCISVTEKGLISDTQQSSGTLPHLKTALQPSNSLIYETGPRQMNKRWSCRLGINVEQSDDSSHKQKMAGGIIQPLRIANTQKHRNCTSYT